VILATSRVSRNVSQHVKTRDKQKKINITGITPQNMGNMGSDSREALFKYRS